MKAAKSFDTLKACLSNFLGLIPVTLRLLATAAVEQTHWLTIHHHVGRTSDDLSGTTDKLTK